MKSRTVTTIENLQRAESELRSATLSPISYRSMRAVNEYVRFTEEFAVDVPGEASIVVVGLGPGRIHLDVDRGAAFESSAGHDINKLTAVELGFLSWLRTRLEQWQSGDADLIAILELSKGWKP